MHVSNPRLVILNADTYLEVVTILLIRKTHSFPFLVWIEQRREIFLFSTPKYCNYKKIMRNIIKY